MDEPICRCGHGEGFHRYSTGMGACDFNDNCPKGCTGFNSGEVPRIATSMEDLEVGQMIASLATFSGPEELVRAGRVVGFVDHNVEVDNEVGEVKKIGFHNGNTVFILADPPTDPVEAAWDEWCADTYEYRVAVAHKAFIAGWAARSSVEST